MDLVTYARIRDDLLARITGSLDADSRVVAAWLSGSFGRGEADAWSDLDLHLAVEDEALPAFLDQRVSLYRQVGEPTLIQGAMASNAMAGSLFQLVLYPGPVEVDWTIGPVSEATRRPETTILFARRDIPIEIPEPAAPEAQRSMASEALSFFWAMAPIAVKYAGRGESRRASSQIDLLTGAFIQLWRLVERPDGPDPAAPFQNRATEPELDAILPRLGREITPDAALAVIEALGKEVERLHPALEALGVQAPQALVAELAAFADLARRAIEEAPSPTRRVFR